MSMGNNWLCNVQDEQILATCGTNRSWQLLGQIQPGNFWDKQILATFGTNRSLQLLGQIQPGNFWDKQILATFGTNTTWQLLGQIDPGNFLDKYNLAIFRNNIYILTTLNLRKLAPLHPQGNSTSVQCTGSRLKSRKNTKNLLNLVVDVL